MAMLRDVSYCEQIKNKSTSVNQLHNIYCRIVIKNIEFYKQLYLPYLDSSISSTPVPNPFVDGLLQF
ncbi:hypothetical protein Ahia01_000396300 [Argonauta hians]